MRALALLAAAGALCAAGVAVAADAAHPDFSGVWVISKRSTMHYVDAKGQPLSPLPFTPEGAAIRAKADPALDPSTKCLNMFPRIMGWPYPLQFVQTPKETVVLFEADTIYRQIYTDGRQLDVDSDPVWMGHSVGHWEGDTLVAETVGVKDMAWLDGDGTPISDQMHVTERFHLIDGGKSLEDDIKIDDPKTFTTPVYKTLIYNAKPTWTLMEYICEEGNRDDAFNQKAGQPGSLQVPSANSPKPPPSE